MNRANSLTAHTAPFPNPAGQLKPTLLCLNSSHDPAKAPNATCNPPTPKNQLQLPLPPVIPFLGFTQEKRVGCQRETKQCSRSGCAAVCRERSGGRWSQLRTWRCQTSIFRAAEEPAPAETLPRRPGRGCWTPPGQHSGSQVWGAHRGAHPRGAVGAWETRVSTHAWAPQRPGVCPAPLQPQQHQDSLRGSTQPRRLVCSCCRGTAAGGAGAMCEAARGCRGSRAGFGTLGHHTLRQEVEGSQEQDRIPEFY